VCNYSCWYCDDYFHNGRYRWPDLQASIDFFKAMCENKEHVVLDIQGGEPSLWPKLQDFIDAKPDNLEIELSSNGSRTVEWWKRNYEKLNHVTLSFHPEADIEHFKRVLSTIATGEISVHVFLLGDADIHDRNKELLSFIKDNSLHLTCKLKVIDSRAGNSVKDRVISNKSKLPIEEFHEFSYNNAKHPPTKKVTEIYLDEQKLDMISIMYNEDYKFKGWTCNAGVTRFYIRANGDIYRASCSNDPKIGNIVFDTDIFDLKPTVCRMKECPCADDIKVEKWL